MKYGSDGKNFYEEVLAQSEYGYLAKKGKWKNNFDAETYDLKEIRAQR